MELYSGSFVTISGIILSIINLVTLYKMHQFFSDAEKQKLISDHQTVRDLKNLYLITFSIQIMSILFIVFLSLGTIYKMRGQISQMMSPKKKTPPKKKTK